MCSAPGSNPGAITTSVNTSLICRATASVTTPFSPMTPPNADSGSHRSAAWCACARSSPTAIPHGFECFMIATQGFLKEYAALRAASPSTKLL